MSEICYGHSSPNAVILPNYGPCNPQANSISLCCETGQTCLTNGLCVTQSGVYYNGGCTDSTYKAAICPTFCTAGMYYAIVSRLAKLTFVPGDANWVIECHGSAIKDGDFCCSVNGTTTTCCNTASNGLGLDAAVSSAQAMSAKEGTVPAFVSASTPPISISSGGTTSSSASITGAYFPFGVRIGARILTISRFSHIYIPSNCHFQIYASKQDGRHHRNQYRFFCGSLCHHTLCSVVDQAP